MLQIDANKCCDANFKVRKSTKTVGARRIQWHEKSPRPFKRRREQLASLFYRRRSKDQQKFPEELNLKNLLEQWFLAYKTKTFKSLFKG